jgi:hypothetical protein
MYFGERAKQSNEKLDENFSRNLSSFIITRKFARALHREKIIFYRIGEAEKKYSIAQEKHGSGTPPSNPSPLFQHDDLSVQLLRTLVDGGRSVHLLTRKILFLFDLRFILNFSFTLIYY